MEKPEDLSIARCLRVVGQYLEAHPVRSFHLTTVGSTFVITSDDLAHQRQADLLSQLRRKLLAHDEAAPSNYVIFTRPQLLALDLERHAERTLGSMLDRRDLSFVLRVLGDYFDRKGAGEFTVDWSRGSIRIRYDDRQENFTHADLYDLGVRMYLRRAGRPQ